MKNWEQLAYHFSVRGHIEAGQADIKAGRVVDGQEVLRWLKSWGTANELPIPRPRRR